MKFKAFIKLWHLVIYIYIYEKVINNFNYCQGYEGLQLWKFNKVIKVTWILFEYIQYITFMVLKYYKISFKNHFLELLMKNNE
jgi:hypothetical protein